MIKQERLLIISNNVLSTTNNNGKTILSCIDSIPQDQVQQLYFSNETPTVSGYRYFKISDTDVIRTRFMGVAPGTSIAECDANDTNPQKRRVSLIKRNSVSLMLRNALWSNAWKSDALFKWLDDFNPTVVLFVAGDCLFAYEICKFIKNKYKTRLCVYVTDDYVMPRTSDKFFDRRLRNRIRSVLHDMLKETNVFFTISETMKTDYKELFGKDSHLLFNMTDSLRISDYSTSKDDYPIVFSYTGSLYYGRDIVLNRIGRIINEYNCKAGMIKGVLNIYSNSSQEKAKINENSGCRLCGSLNLNGLKETLNQSDVLVFVESSDPQYIEKTKYSFSTKIPEYLSVGRLILAVGPQNVSSISYLEDCAICESNFDNLEQTINDIISNRARREEYAEKALKKYEDKHNRSNMQQVFIDKVMGVK